MIKLYYLSTCDTCKRILSELGLAKPRPGLELQDLKTAPVTTRQLEQLKALAGSYEALFNRRSIKYREMGLKDQPLTESDYKQLLLQEYTFLKRPAVIIGNRLFAGSEKKTVEALAQALKELK
ncbi:arsenate reductase family protein [Niabella terrae]